MQLRILQVFFGRIPKVYIFYTFVQFSRFNRPRAGAGQLDQYGTSKVVDVEDPSSIAQGVNSLLCNPDEYAMYCCNVKNAFESEFNFEKQFKPVLKCLELQVI